MPVFALGVFEGEQSFFRLFFIEAGDEGIGGGGHFGGDFLHGRVGFFIGENRLEKQEGKEGVFHGFLFVGILITDRCYGG